MKSGLERAKPCQRKAGTAKHHPTKHLHKQLFFTPLSALLGDKHSRLEVLPACSDNRGLQRGLRSYGFSTRLKPSRDCCSSSRQTWLYLEIQSREGMLASFFFFLFSLLLCPLSSFNLRILWVHQAWRQEETRITLEWLGVSSEGAVVWNHRLISLVRTP